MRITLNDKVNTLTGPTVIKFIHQKSMFHWTDSVPVKDRVLTIDFTEFGDSFSDIVPPISVIGGGLNIIRPDNKVFEYIEVYRSPVECNIYSARQCHFMNILINQCYGDSVLNFSSVNKDRGDATNNNLFSLLSIRNCASKKYLGIYGGGKPGGMNLARNLHFLKVFLHCPWDNGRPTEESIAELFGPKSRLFLDLVDTTAINIDMCHITCDPTIAEDNSISLTNVNDFYMKASIRGNTKRSKLKVDKISDFQVDWMR